jgi:DNA-binding winged helix-turn-helix (wHTH) protein
MDGELDAGSDRGISDLDRLGVELVHWPRDEVLRRRLARAGIARLLLVEHDAEPPSEIGVDEDWVRLPADEAELWNRAERLGRLSAALDGEVPVLHESRVLTHGPGAVVLSKSEAVAIRLLLDSIGEVVPRHVLNEALWPNGPPSGGRALDALIERLRRRIVRLHLCIRCVRTKGFLIYMDSARRSPAGEHNADRGDGIAQHRARGQRTK